MTAKERISLSILALAFGAACSEPTAFVPPSTRVDPPPVVPPGSSPTPPRVVRTTPVNGAWNLAVDASFEVEFSEPIDSSSIRPTSIAVVRTSGISSKLQIVSSTVVRLTPNEILRARSAYVLVVAGVKDLQGEIMIGEYVVNFQTGPGLQVDPASLSGELVFESERDGNTEIYRASVGSSDATRLTFNQGYDGEAAWSPDGARIAFASARERDASDKLLEKVDIYVMNADGSNVTRLTSTGSARNPSWSPDSRRIAFEYDPLPMGAGDLAIVDASGASNTVEYAGLTRLDVSSPEWSRDGLSIAFLADQYSNARMLSYRLSDATTSTIFNPGPWAEMWSLAWHPSMPSLLSTYCIMDRDDCKGGGAILVTQTGELQDIAFDANVGAYDVKWSPDGSGITGSIWQCEPGAQTQTDRERCYVSVVYFSSRGEAIIARRARSADWRPN